MRNIEIIITSLTILLSGCISQNVNIQTTQSWENHYLTVQEFKEGTKNINLQKNETIWVISNTTLKHILKEVNRKNNK